MGKSKKNPTTSSFSTTTTSSPKQIRKPKSEKCESKLIKRKEWRLKKFGEIKIEKMSSTTMRLFRKWGHRAQEIRTFISNKLATKS